MLVVKQVWVLPLLVPTVVNVDTLVGPLLSDPRQLWIPLERPHTTSYGLTTPPSGNFAADFVVQPQDGFDCLRVTNHTASHGVSLKAGFIFHEFVK